MAIHFFMKLPGRDSPDVSRFFVMFILKMLMKKAIRIGCARKGLS